MLDFKIFLQFMKTDIEIFSLKYNPTKIIGKENNLIWTLNFY